MHAMNSATISAIIPVLLAIILALQSYCFMWFAIILASMLQIIRSHRNHSFAPQSSLPAIIWFHVVCNHSFALQSSLLAIVWFHAVCNHSFAPQSSLLAIIWFHAVCNHSFAPQSYVLQSSRVSIDFAIILVSMLQRNHMVCTGYGFSG